MVLDTMDGPVAPCVSCAGSYSSDESICCRLASTVLSLPPLFSCSLFKDSRKATSPSASAMSRYCCHQRRNLIRGSGMYVFATEDSMDDALCGWLTMNVDEAEEGSEARNLVFARPVDVASLVAQIVQHGISWHSTRSARAASQVGTRSSQMCYVDQKPIGLPLPLENIHTTNCHLCAD